MDSLTEQLLHELNRRRWNRDGYIPVKVANNMSRNKIHNLIRWMADKAEALDE